MKFNPKHSVLCESRVLHDKRLSCTDLRVYLHLKFRFQFFSQTGKEYFESFPVISDAIDVSVRSITTSVDNLKELGYLSVERRGRGSYIFTVL